MRIESVIKPMALFFICFNIANSLDMNVLLDDVKKEGMVTPPDKMVFSDPNAPITCPRLQQFTLATDPETLNLTYYAKLGLEVMKKMAALNENTVGMRLPDCQFPNIVACAASERFRRADGSCTNFKIPERGKAKTPFKRVIKPRFQNDIDEPLKKLNGFDLPNPRSVALALCFDTRTFDIKRTSINHAFGQFVDHDVTHTLTPDIPCKCGDPSPECINIKTPPEDILNINTQACMTTVRSDAVPVDYKCNIAYREQLNVLTAALDLSQVYGNDQEKQLSLRNLTTPYLRGSPKPNSARNYLPADNDLKCRDTSTEMPCFQSADRRTNINMNLAAMHTLWFREHNRIAQSLKTINPSWSNEVVFQEARRINIAQMQNIVYTEWLPLIIGINSMVKYDLLSTFGPNYYYGYNESVDITPFNEFSTAAFRLHTFVRDNFTQINSDGTTQVFSFTEMTFRPTIAFQKSGLDGLLKGALVDLIGKFDLSMSFNLQNRLLEVPGKINDFNTTARFDLIALNINRCRDHGCASYIQFREWCGLGKATSFADLVEIDEATQEKLAEIYKVVDNIEVFVGGQAERPLPGAMVGRTISCMIASQFRDFKKGDRYFFENPAPANPYPFTSAQLDNLHKATLSSVLCQNVDDLTSIQPNAFVAQTEKNNAAVPCSQIPKLDLTLWKA